jgi:hypothetical protein
LKVLNLVLTCPSINSLKKGEIRAFISNKKIDEDKKLAIQTKDKDEEISTKNVEDVIR